MVPGMLVQRCARCLMRTYVTGWKPAGNSRSKPLIYGNRCLWIDFTNFTDCLTITVKLTMKFQKQSALESMEL